MFYNLIYRGRDLIDCALFKTRFLYELLGDRAFTLVIRFTVVLSRVFLDDLGEVSESLAALYSNLIYVRMFVEYGQHGIYELLIAIEWFYVCINALYGNC